MAGKAETLETCDILVHKKQIGKTEVMKSIMHDAKPGQIVARVEKFGFSANNISCKQALVANQLKA